MEYIYIVIPITTLILAQVAKFIIEGIQEKRFDIGRLLNGSGGMPSGHSAFITSITTLIGMNVGFDSPLFGLAFAFSLIVFYDATHVRYQAGLLAEYLNKQDTNNKFIERLGHTKMEVLGGIIFGIVVTLLLSNLF